jgi:WD40 repeat protein/transcriptional regulator with XRE-family HTH domain
MLRYLRRRAGITQMELAIAVGYSDAQISRLEQNLRLPDIPTIEARFIPALYLEEDPGAAARLMELAVSVRREDAPTLGLCPYKGLYYFDENDADLFVGREALTSRLVDRLLSLAEQQEPPCVRVLAVVGASGSGKSSLVRAGLIPSLRWDPRMASWQIHSLTPTARPLESLAEELTRGERLTVSAALTDDLARESRGLHLFAKRSTRAAGASRLLLVVDQFEELFTLCRSEGERQSFIDNLITGASAPDGPVIVVLTLRADFYASCAAYPRLREALAEHQEYIGAMNREELRRVIEEPALRGQWELEAGLADLLLQDIGREPGALPLLSHALLETWKRRRGRMMTLSGYTSSGGVRGAIAETAEAVFIDHLTQAQQAIARRIFLRLTEFGDENAAADTRRRASLDELHLEAGDATTTQAVLQALADARLISMEEHTAEVAHEALIREWPRLHDWLEENRESLRLHRQLTQASNEWLAMHRDPGLLFRGVRLAQLQAWARTHADEMNALESEFLDASQSWADREEAERDLQRQRELEAAQRLAEAQRARAEEQASSVKRLRQRGVLLITALILAIVGAVFAGVFARRAQQQALVSSVRELSSVSNANLEVDPERSVLLALQAVKKTYTRDHTVLPEAADALHQAVQASRIELTLLGHTGTLWSAVYSPDGTRIATAGADQTARIWDAATGKELQNLKATAYGSVWYASFSPDGKFLATAGEDRVARIWDVATGDRVRELKGHVQDVFHIEFSPDGRRLVTVSPDATAKIWDVQTGKELLSMFQGSDAAPYWVVFSPDGSRIAVANTAEFNDGWVSIWDSASGRLVLNLPRQSTRVDSVTFSPDGSRLVTTADDQTVRIWDANSGRELLRLYGYTTNATNAAYSPDGMRIATVFRDNQVKVWDAETGQELFNLAGHSNDVLTVAFSPDGTRLVTASKDGTARVWDATPTRELLTLENGSVKSSIGVAHLAYRPDGTRLAAAYSDSTAKVWDVATGKLVLQLSAHTDRVSCITYSADGKRIASGSLDGTASVWDAASGQLLTTVSIPGSMVLGVAFSKDGTRLATASTDSRAKIWDVSTGKLVRTLSGYNDWVTSVAFSPDGSHLVAASFDTEVLAWDTATGRAPYTFNGHVAPVRQAVYSPDGRRVATASFDGTAKLWDAASGRPLLTFAGHTGNVFSVAFSPDGRYVATAGGDRTARVWDAQTGRQIQILRAPGGLTDVAFSPDGKHLAVASLDGTDRIYALQIEDLLALASKRVTRSLTPEECQEYLHVSTCPAALGAPRSLYTSH